MLITGLFSNFSNPLSGKLLLADFYKLSDHVQVSILTISFDAVIIHSSTKNRVGLIKKDGLLVHQE